jgi:diguanylate cyclase (GGDEF)-like protein
MLLTIIATACFLAAVVVISGLLGFGTNISLQFASGWLVFLSAVLLTWPHLSVNKRGVIALLILASLIARWSYSWLIAPPREAMIGILIVLLYTPVLIVITTLMFSGKAVFIGILVGAALGTISFFGTSREVLAPLYLNDWRIAPLILCVYALFAWLLKRWVNERYALELSAQREQQLTLESNTDQLTGLANRRACDARFQQLDAGPRKYAIIMLDLDHFKQVNDTHGHNEGDRVLRRVVSLLIGKLRPNDFIARWGGEEFLVILESISSTDAKAVSDALCQSIEDGTANDTIPITVSVGLALSANGQTAMATLKSADDALYTAKTAGRNRVRIAFQSEKEPSLA